MDHHRTLFPLVLCAAAIGLTVWAGPAQAGQGITIGEQSSTKTLSPVGKSDSETTVYSDTMGLSPQPDFNEIQNNANFIMSERALPAAQPTQAQQEQAKAQSRLEQIPRVQAARENAQINLVEAPAVEPAVSEAREKFIFFDKDENGLLGLEEFFLYELEPDARQVFMKLDQNADGAISFNEFEPYFIEKKG